MTLSFGHFASFCLDVAIPANRDGAGRSSMGLSGVGRLVAFHHSAVHCSSDVEIGTSALPWPLQSAYPDHGCRTECGDRIVQD
jgi:hypothetical protein